MVSNGDMKAWFMKLVIGSLLIIMILWLCSFDIAGKKQSDWARQGENGKHRQVSKETLSLEETPQQNHFLASLREWLPNLGFWHQLQERSKNKEQQPSQQKHQNKTSSEEFQKRRRRSNGTEVAINSLTREAVHDPHNAGLMYNYTDVNTTKYLTRFLVTRDPYSRLLSSYIDKIYLPDFWEAEVVEIAKNLSRNSSSNDKEDFLRKHFNEMAKIFQKKPNVRKITTHADSTCGKYMTFSEFVEAGLDRAEPHWMPIHTICNPCQFKATHISTIETFAADARFILSRLNLEHAIENLDHKMQVDEEINMISQYNFNIYYKIKAEAFYKSCVGPREIAYRLWHNFQWRGYIDPDVKYKIPDVKALQNVKADFMAQVKVARESGLQNPKKMKAAQKEFKRKAYLSISKTTFERITQKYAMDFELFGYTDERDEMYTYYSTEGH